MSKASTLRDAVIVELQAVIPTTTATVEACLVPEYQREALVAGPRIGVRYSERSELTSTMGPDTQAVTIEIAVVGVLPGRSDSSQEVYTAAQVAALDGFDALSETIIALFLPRGPLIGKDLGGHRFMSLSQPLAYEPEKMADEEQFVSIIELIFVDQEDE